jgi:hypothetical protein
LEAYPIDPSGKPDGKPGSKRIDPSSAYVGTISMFEKEGFHRVVETAARSAGLPRWLVRLELSSPSSDVIG